MKFVSLFGLRHGVSLAFCYPKPSHWKLPSEVAVSRSSRVAYIVISFIDST